MNTLVSVKHFKDKLSYLSVSIKCAILAHFYEQTSVSSEWCYPVRFDVLYVGVVMVVVVNLVSVSFGVWGEGRFE